MNWVTIENVKPWDGRYQFDLDDQELTTREWSWIKKLSGYLPLTLQQGLEGADPELFCAFAVIALYRADKIQPAEAPQTYERLLDAPFGSTIRLESDDEEAAEETDVGPPASSSNGSSSISGDDSKTSSASSDATPAPTGTPGSVTSVSPPQRLVT